MLCLILYDPAVFQLIWLTVRTGFRTWLSGAEEVRDKIPFLLCAAQTEFVVVKQHYTVNMLPNLHI